MSRHSLQPWRDDKPEPRNGPAALLLVAVIAVAIAYAIVAFIPV